MSLKKQIEKKTEKIQSIISDLDFEQSLLTGMLEDIEVEEPEFVPSTLEDELKNKVLLNLKNNLSLKELDVLEGKVKKMFEVQKRNYKDF